ncbi:MAG TPA: hypothetical protein VMT80_01185 [Candidatus Paceibacterota bacterium]|nr:hypothetical protein [Candidatus Paceibacterota bacterium]
MTTQGTEPEAIRITGIATNDNHPIPFICKCATCVHRAGVTGSEVNTQVFCVSEGRYVYASEKANACPAYALKVASTTILRNAPPS